MPTHSNDPRAVSPARVRKAPGTTNLTFLHSLIEDFFREERVSLGVPMTLLEIACMGKPEGTLQGALYHYILSKLEEASKKIYLVKEAAYIGKSARRYFDFLVLDAARNPIGVIELKHFGANQGGLSTLYRDMEADLRKKRKGLPIFVVGVYTAVEGISPECLPSRNAFERYNYIRSYVFKKSGAAPDFNKATERIVAVPNIKPGLNAGKKESTDSGYRLTGEQRFSFSHGQLRISVRGRQGYRVVLVPA